MGPGAEREREREREGSETGREKGARGRARLEREGASEGEFRLILWWREVWGSKR